MSIKDFLFGCITVAGLIFLAATANDRKNVYEAPIVQRPIDQNGVVCYSRDGPRPAISCVQLNKTPGQKETKQ
jgi:hypothetical protein